ncbi:MAG: molybdate ABC transporter substrate-binding protein [Syntrophobacterales bacterium]|jgi:molybdate transport system substrate-binding protein|nr:molybdate ABC transporter substrate-binding protein [Syntrophobacterales bacterium]
MKKIALLLAVLFTALTLPGCEQKVENSREITVAAAADLINAFTEAGKDFEKAGGCKVVFSFGSTGMLAEQIANGAPFDVFAAANEIVISDLDKGGHIVSDTIKLYALGRIGVATLKNANIRAETITDLLQPEIKKIAIANPDHAPYGLAAKQALISAGAWNKLEPKLVFGKNISETLQFVTTGNADAGIIALSLNDSNTLNFHLIDAGLHKPLRQAMAVIKRTKNEEQARKFVAFINSAEGKTIMSKYGFVAPE